MSDQTEELNWDDVLGSVDAEEKENPAKPQGDFEPLPAGPYKVVVQEAEKQVAASSGNDMIKVRLQVTDGPYANRILFSYIVFAKGNPKSMRITLDKLACFGVTREYIGTAKPSIPAIAEMLEGQTAIARVGIQDKGEYKGRNEVNGFKPLEGSTPATPAADPKPAGVPNIPTPEVEASVPTPNIPLPDVAVGGAAGGLVDPFES